MELTKSITFRVTDEEYEALNSMAEEQRRSVAWIAREAMRKGLKETD